MLENICMFMKSRMELYMMNKPHGRMILASIEKGPLAWPSITVDAYDLGRMIKLLMQGNVVSTKLRTRGGRFGRQNFFCCGGTSRTYHPRSKWNSTAEKQRRFFAITEKGEGAIMSRQCSKPKGKGKRDDSWFKEKVLLVQAQAHGQILNEEELAFLVDLDIPEGQSTLAVITHNATYQAVIWMHMTLIVTDQLAKCALMENLFIMVQMLLLIGTQS
ncbi:hypothetical protein Tco_0601634 [Tanacetum coccineum]